MSSQSKSSVRGAVCDLVCTRLLVFRFHVWGGVAGMFYPVLDLFARLVPFQLSKRVPKEIIFKQSSSKQVFKRVLKAS